MKKERIQRKVAANFIAIVSVVLIMFGVYQCYEIKSIYVEEMNVFVKNTSDKLPQLLVYPIWNMDTEVIQKTVASTMLDKQVYAVLVKENDGTLMNGKTRNEDWEVVSVEDKFENIFEDKFIVIQKKIVKNEDPIGSIDIYITKRFMTEKLKCEMQKIALTVLFMDIIAFILIWFINLNTIKPIFDTVKMRNDEGLKQ